MSDSLIYCPRCTSDACYESKGQDDFCFWFCYGCGFHSNSTLTINNPELENVMNLYPELYRDLKFIDEKGHYWFPFSYNDPSVGMVFADGNSVLNWKWAAVLPTEIAKSERKKFPKGQKFKMDMKTLKHFDERDFMEALDYIGYFK